jgi:hypothetical protein
MLFDHWWSLMSCAVFTAIGTIQAHFQKSNRWLVWAVFVAALFLLFVSSFLAWRDQYRENQVARDIGSLSLEAASGTLFLGQDPHGFGMQVFFRNRTDRLIDLHIDSFAFTLDGTQEKGKIINSGGYVYGNGLYTYTTGAIPVLSSTQVQFRGTIEYSFSYHAVGSKIVHHSKKAILYDCYVAPPGRTTYQTLSEFED